MGKNRGGYARADSDLKLCQRLDLNANLSSKGSNPFPLPQALLKNRAFFIGIEKKSGLDKIMG
jgi:hypothetical protein